MKLSAKLHSVVDPLGLKILLIEDDPDDHVLIRHGLKIGQGSSRLVWTQTLAEGIQELETSQYDVVLTDLSLPDSMGLQAVERIRAMNQDIPIIVLTTLDDVETEMAALAVGAQEYLIKDEATKHVLLRAIDHAICRQHALVEIQKLLTEVSANQKMLAEQRLLLKRKNRRLKKLYRTAHRFVDNVSHEFRTPLTVIKDYVSLVSEGVVGQVTDKQRQMLDIASVRTDELNNMVDDMLDLSKLESGMLGVWRQACRIEDIVETVATSLHHRAATKNIGFQVSIDDHLPQICCDIEKIGRVIINLVTNAIKFCGEPGQRHLWARKSFDEESVEVGITDDGAGIDQSQINEIFKRFRQVKSRLSHGTKGFGLGLGIAKELVALNFGDISVESEDGKGTTFSFTIPRNDHALLLRKYTEQLIRKTSAESDVAIVSLQVDRSVSESDAEDVDAFVNLLLRKNDLIFRISTHDWLLALSIPPSEFECFTTNAIREWKKLNRNRPFGPIAAYQMKREGNWNLKDQNDDLLKSFHQLQQRILQQSIRTDDSIPQKIEKFA